MAGEDGVGESSFTETVVAEEDSVRHQVDEITSRVDKLEVKVSEVSSFFSSTNRPNNGANARACGGGARSIAKDKEREKEKDKEKSAAVVHKKLIDLPRKDSGCTKRMQELMRQFGTILRQIIKKPMDFETIRKKMEVKDGSGYRDVREIYADVRLVFANAMTYNDEKNDVHQMARTLLEKFEEKWLQLLPKVLEEEMRQKEEEAKALVEMEMAQKAAVTKIAKETDNELNDIYMQLEDLRETLLRKCRKMTTEEKRKLGAGLSQLSPEDLNRALEIIAQNNPSFQAAAEEVDLDMDALSESTLWRLSFFVKKSLEMQAKGSATKSQDNSKRKKEIIDALAKTHKRRTKKVV